MWLKSCPSGDAESSARSIKAPCRESITRQHVVGGICVIAGERVAALAMQIAVAKNSTESAAKICQHIRRRDTDPRNNAVEYQIAAPVAAERQVQVRLAVVLNQREPTE